MRYDVGQNLSPTTLVKKPYINVVVFPISAADVLSKDNNLFSSLSFSKFNTSQSSSFRRRRSNNDEGHQFVNSRSRVPPWLFTHEDVNC